jgi:hypothetical protein
MATNKAANYPEETLALRFNIMDADREAKLFRARDCASLTISQLLPPENWTEQDPLPQPFSSAAAKGVVSMSSRMLSALMPLNDMPFFEFSLKDGTEPSPDVYALLEALSYQVYRRLSAGNLRSTVFQALQSLIVVGDVLMIMEDDFTYRLVRLDQYQLRRDVKGMVREIIYLEYELGDPSEPAWEYDLTYGGSSDVPFSRQGYKTILCRWVYDDEASLWWAHKEYADGTRIDGGKYEECPIIPLRWSGVISENYGRSHTEENFGDIQTLESLTKAMIMGMAASSIYWPCLNPSSVSEIDDVAPIPSGHWMSVKKEDVSVISPAEALRFQLDATNSSVTQLRQIIAKAFLNETGQIRQAERVTATEVRLVGQQLEEVLGGAFSSIAKDLLEPLVKRTVFLMIENGEIDPRIKNEFTKDGKLSVSIVTGLQALSRDQDLTKLMQMGEMVRNLPPEASALFNYEEYGRALVASIGFDPRNWIRTREEVQEEQLKMQQQQQQAQAMANVAQQGMGAAAQVAGEAAGAAGAAQAQSMITPAIEQMMAQGGGM